MPIEFNDTPAPRRLVDCPEQGPTPEQGAIIHAGYLEAVEAGLIPPTYALNVRCARGPSWQHGATEAFSNGVIWVHLDVTLPPAALADAVLHESAHVGFLLMPVHDAYRLNRVSDRVEFLRLEEENERFARAFAARTIMSAALQAAIRRAEVAATARANGPRAGVGA